MRLAGHWRLISLGVMVLSLVVFAQPQASSVFASSEAALLSFCQILEAWNIEPLAEQFQSVKESFQRVQELLNSIPSPDPFGDESPTAVEDSFSLELAAAPFKEIVALNTYGSSYSNPGVEAKPMPLETAIRLGNTLSEGLADTERSASPPMIALSSKQAEAAADYGEAPDELPAQYSERFAEVIGHFPTLKETTNSRIRGLPGAHALEVPVAEAEILGDRISWEVDARDPADPDGTPNLIFDDFNDGLQLAPLPPELMFNVRLGPEALPGPRYINVLIDLNRDGTWDPLGAIVEAADEGVRVVKVIPGTPADAYLQPDDLILAVNNDLIKTPGDFARSLRPAEELAFQVRRGNQDLEFRIQLSSDEWIVKNLQVDAEPGRIKGVRHRLSASVLEALAATPSPAWMRVLLSPIPLDESIPWDGSGQFTAGEVEDYPLLGFRRATLLGGMAAAATQAASQALAFARAAEDANAQAQAAAAAAQRAESQADARQRSFSASLSMARARAEDAARATDTAFAWASRIDTARAEAQEAISRVFNRVVRIPCGTVVANVRATAEASSAALAQAVAVAGAAAEAAAQAKATAEAIAGALAVAYADARAHARAVAEARAAAVAAASASARAAAAAASHARAAAAAASSVTTLMREVGIALAVGTQLRDAVAQMLQAVVTAQAQAFSAAWAAAAAHAEAKAQALAAAVAQARAETYAVALARAATWAASFAEAVAEAVASAEAAAEAGAAAYANAQAIARVAANIEGSINAVIDPNCLNRICEREEPPPPREERVSLRVEARFEDDPISIDVTINGNGYKTPATVTVNKGSRVNLSAPDSISVLYWGPEGFQWYIVPFHHWDCSGQQFGSPSISFTIQYNTTCIAYYYLD